MGISSQTGIGYHNGFPVISHDGFPSQDNVEPYILETKRIIPVNVSALPVHMSQKIGLIWRVHSFVINLLNWMNLFVTLSIVP